jgi:hypothetical protein
VGKEFEYILDKCIAQIRNGEADVASCLNKYPEYAAQLRPLLEIAVLLYREPQPQPRPEAVSRGERILLERVAEKRSSKAVDEGLAGAIRASLGVVKLAFRGAPLPSMRWRLRWVGIVAGIIAFTLIGYGVVTASNYSMPGDFLYPLKTERERVQLILTPSEVGKSEFHIVLAERRMQEITELSRRGKGDQVAELMPIVGQHLEEVRQVLATTGETKFSEELKIKLEDSAVQQLAELEGAFQEANEETKPVIAEALKASGESYGTAVEDAIANAPVAAVIGDMGTIQVIVTDPPSPEEIDSAVVQVEKIEAHLAAGPDSRWVTLVSEPTSFDLMELVGGKEINLGIQKVDTGTYTQVRMNIVEATITVDGVEHDVSIPSRTLKFIRPFKVKGEETTVIILDFDGKGSIHSTGSGKYMLKPVVSLLISEMQGELSGE